MFTEIARVPEIARVLEWRMIVDAVVGQRVTVILADIGFVGSVLVTVYGAFKVSYQRRMGRVLDTRVSRWVDVFVDMFGNAPGTINKALIASGRAPLLPHPGVVAAEARADAAEARAEARTTMLVPPATVLRVDTLPGVPATPPTE